MEDIIIHSVTKASEEAVKLWALSSSQYPLNNKLIQDYTNATFIEVISSFSLNARRSLEIMQNKKYSLVSARWNWTPTKGGEVVNDLWDALNRVVHAQKLIVGWEQLPENISVIDGGALVIPYIMAQTDRKELSFINPFAMSYAFLYEVLKDIYAFNKPNFIGNMN